MNKNIKNIIGVMIVVILSALASTMVIDYFQPSELGYAPTNYFSSATNSTVTLTAATSSTVLAANTGRLFAYIANEGGGIVNLSLGETAVASQGIELQSGESYQFTTENMFTGAIYGYALATTSLSVVSK